MQRARVLRRRRHDDLQPGRAVEPGLGVLAVVRTRVPQPAPRHPDDHRHRPAPPVPDLRGVVDELVEAGGDEIVELHLADRPLAGERGADADAEHAAFGERRVDDAIAELLQQRTEQQERVAVLAADVLAVDEHARIGPQRVADAQHHRFEKCAAVLVERQSRFEARQRWVQIDVSRSEGSSGSSLSRGGSAANTPTPAVLRFRPGASTMARASARPAPALRA